MYLREVIHLNNNSNYRQYAPYDIIAVDETFHKLYDRRNRLFRFDDLDDHNNLPLGLIFHCAENTTWEEVLNNSDWLKIETPLRRSSCVNVNRRFIHKSVEEEYLKRTNGDLIWSPQFVYEVIVNKHRVTLTSENYKDFMPRRMLAISSVENPISEIIDENGGWFFIDGIKMSELQSVFSNWDDFKFETDDTFFHMGMGTGMWVDRSIVAPFSKDAERIYSGGKPPLPDGTKIVIRGNLHPVWREVVWGIIESRNE